MIDALGPVSAARSRSAFGSSVFPCPRPWDSFERMATRQPPADFASAALRHMRDAEHLVEAGGHESRDQAWHLAGFAHECARKACLKDGWVPKLLGHDFSDASDDVLGFAIALDPRAGRFPVRQWRSRFPAVAAWHPNHRYERTGTSDRTAGRDIDLIVAQGRQAVDDCFLALFFDGSLAAESLQ